MIVIIDYGVGNLFSLQSSFKAIGEDVVVSCDENIIKNAKKIILPGVGAFGDAMKKLEQSGLIGTIKDMASNGTPLLGICLGMQLLFETGEEHGVYEGLGLLKGQVIPISRVIPQDLKIPHMGWNSLHFPENKEKNDLFKYVESDQCVYFVHSYFASNCENSVIATTDYGATLTAAVGKDNIYGCQFHPEKSGTVGLNILKAFCQL